VCRTEAREELRRQVGTLRFDLNTLASTKGKEAKKETMALRKDFIRAVRVGWWLCVCVGGGVRGTRSHGACVAPTP
jgi:hypothetical protein